MEFVMPAILILAIVGFIIGYMLGRISRVRPDGLFILDDSDPDTTRWILDVKTDPDEIKNKKEIHLKVCKMDEEGV